MSGNINHADSDKFVISEGFCERDDNCDKSYCFFTHSENCPEKSEQEHYKDNDNITDSCFADNGITFKVPHLGYELHNAFVYSLGTVYNPECTTYYKHKCNDACLLGETIIQSRKNLPCLRITSWYDPGRQST